jgi:hypothetical protein
MCQERKSMKLVEQRLGFHYLGGIEALSEPVMDRREKIAGPTRLPWSRHRRAKVRNQGRAAAER